MRIHPLADDGARLRGVDRRDVDRRAVLPLRLALVQVQHLPLDVVDTAELMRIADRPVDRRRRNAQCGLDVVHQRERILGGPIELVDERENRQPVTPADLVELSRLRLDAVRRVDHHDDAVGGDERAVGVLAEVLVAGRVEERHPPPLNLELERRRRNRDAALLLELHPVGRRGLAILAAANRAGQLDRAGIEQQLFREGGLARVGMGDDGEGAPARDLALELALDGLVENHLRDCCVRRIQARHRPSELARTRRSSDLLSWPASRRLNRCRPVLVARVTCVRKPPSAFDEREDRL